MTTTIFDIARLCLKAFDKALESDGSISTFSFVTNDPHLVSKSRSKSSRDFLSLRNSFTLWIDYTGALSGRQASLDTRLKDSGHIASIVIELLEMILRNLQRSEFAILFERLIIRHSRNCLLTRGYTLH